MPARAIATDLRAKPSMPLPGIWKSATTSATARIAWFGASSNAAAEQVAVEDHVQVLVGGHPGQQLLAERVAGGLAGVAVRDPGGQLLERDVRQRVQHLVVVDVDVAGRHVRHPGPLQRHRVHRPGHGEIVADRDAVPPLLGGPPVHPGAPGAVAAEQRGDLVVVRRQVVLGQQVDHQRGPGHVRDRSSRPATTARRPAARRRSAPRSTARTRAGTTPWPRRGAGRGSPRRPAPAR